MTADTRIDTLEARGLIRLATIEPEIEYLFRHALVQDAAYGSLLKQERRDLHAQVGEALESLYPDRREELAGVLAMHFEQAGETDKAIDYHIAAGNYGLRRNAVREAYAAFERAAELLSGVPADDPATRRRAIQARLGKVEAGYSFLNAGALFDELEELVPLAEALGDDTLTAKVHTLVALGRLQSGEEASSPPVKRSLDRMRQIGREHGDPSLSALPMALIGLGNVFAGSVRDGVAQLAEALPALDEDHDSIAVAFARGALGIGYATLGQFDKALEASARAKKIAEHGDVIARLDALIMESMVRAVMGDLDGAAPLAKECVDLAEETGASACLMTSAWVLGDVFHRQGRFAEAREILQRGESISSIVDRKVWRPTLQAWLSATSTALGEAGGEYETALAMARSIHNPQGEAGILAKRAEAAVRRGDFEPAIDDYRAAAEIFEAQGARPNLARALRELADTLRRAGRTAEAEAPLQRSLALFEEMGLDREAAATRTMLAIKAAPLAFD